MKRTATTTMTVELPIQLKGRLEEIAKTAEISFSEMATDAIRVYLEVQERQIHQIEEGIRQADAGEFADDDEVAAVFAKWLNAR